MALDYGVEWEIVAETLAISERLVIAPTAGRFHPLPPQIFTCEGEWVERGQALAEVSDGRDLVPVISSFSGWVMGMLAMPGQPVVQGEALFWIRGA